MQAEVTNAFELERQQIIARNRARLLALGIPQAIEGLKKLAPVKKPKAPRPKRPAEPSEPSRQSSRLRDRELIARGELPPDVEEGSELAVFIIDGECPRCGKVLSVGHARHLEVCKGPPEPPTEEEIAAKAEAYRSQQKDKLKQLELGGLVDYQPAAEASTAAEGTAGAGEQQPPTEQAAAAEDAQQEDKEQQQQGQKKAKKGAGKGKKKGKQAQAAAGEGVGGGDGEAYAIFVVIGSKGDHYAVKLTDNKRTCQCLDHRFRRHDCKHIRLILQQLGVAEQPKAWEQAVCGQLDALAAADDDDVQRIKKAEDRAQARKLKAAQQQAAAKDTAAAEVEDDAAEGDNAGAAAGVEAAPHEGGADAAGQGSKKKRVAAGRKRKAAAG